jgi:hypothetical protein
MFRSHFAHLRRAAHQSAPSRLAQRLHIGGLGLYGYSLWRMRRQERLVPVKIRVTNRGQQTNTTPPNKAYTSNYPA